MFVMRQQRRQGWVQNLRQSRAVTDSAVCHSKAPELAALRWDSIHDGSMACGCESWRGGLRVLDADWSCVHDQGKCRYFPSSQPACLGLLNEGRPACLSLMQVVVGHRKSHRDGRLWRAASVCLRGSKQRG